MGYGITKAALHRVAGVLRAEHAGSGVRFFNVQPGVIVTERGGIDATSHGELRLRRLGCPRRRWSAQVVAWLVTDPASAALEDRTIEAQFLCHQLGLVPGWPGPAPNRSAVAYDESASALRRLEEQLSAPAGPA